MRCLVSSLRKRSSDALNAALAICMLVGAGRDVAAQDVVDVVTFTSNHVRIVEVDVSPQGFGRVVASTPLPPSFKPGGVVAADGGRYLLWTDLYGGVRAFDRRSRTGLVVPAPEFLWPSVGAQIVASDPYRPRVVIARPGAQDSDNGAYWMVDLTGGGPVLLGPAGTSRPFSGFAAAHAASADLFFYTLRVGSAPVVDTWVVTVEASTGHEVRRWMVPGPIDGMRTDPHGQSVWLDHGGLEKRDAITGALQAASNQFSAANIVQLRADLLLIRQGDFLVALGRDHLTELGRTRVGFTVSDAVRARGTQSLPGNDAASAFTVRVTSRAALVSMGRTGRDDVYDYTCESLAVDAIGPDGRQRGSVELAGHLGGGAPSRGFTEQQMQCQATGVLVRTPEAPDGLAASVAHGTVTLSWHLAMDASEYDLEYGFAPGQRVAAMPVGHATRIAIPAVPPGVYFVRVRARNEVGASAASTEVRVVVP